jgi:hypothetical protein
MADVQARPLKRRRGLGDTAAPCVAEAATRSLEELAMKLLRRGLPWLDASTKLYKPAGVSMEAFARAWLFDFHATPRCAGCFAAFHRETIVHDFTTEVKEEGTFVGFGWNGYRTESFQNVTGSDTLTWSHTLTCSACDANTDVDCTFSISFVVAGDRPDEADPIDIYDVTLGATTKVERFFSGKEVLDAEKRDECTELQDQYCFDKLIALETEQQNLVAQVCYEAVCALCPS